MIKVIVKDLKADIGRETYTQDQHDQMIADLRQTFPQILLIEGELVFNPSKWPHYQVDLEEYCQTHQHISFRLELFTVILMSYVSTAILENYRHRDDIAGVWEWDNES